MGARAILAASLAIAVIVAAAGVGFAEERIPAAPEAAPPVPAEPDNVTLAPAAPAPAEPGPSDRKPPGAGTVGEIRIVPGNIFDIEDPRENNWLFRLANRLHVRTHPWVLRRQLLFRQGDPYDPRLLAESERILRSNGYLFDAQIRPGETRDGRTDVDVRTRDVWTLQPGFSFKREGGKNTSGLDLKEKNLLGLGSSLSISSKSTPDRRTNMATFDDAHLFGTRLQTSIQLATHSDGRKQSYSLERPFYALDARWAAGASYSKETLIDSLTGTGTVAGRFRATKRAVILSGGWSRGLLGGWAMRYLFGGTRDESRFSVPSGETASAPLPADRVIVYPYAGFELIEDDYETARNRDQIERTEDFYLGLRLRATAGYAFPGAGADRHAVPYSIALQNGGRPGKRWTVVGQASADGRAEDGAARDTALAGEGRAYFELSERWLSFASLSGSRLIKPDGDRQLTLGGESGIRGYPLHYQAGDRMYVANLEQRYFSKLYLFRLVRIGAAAFFDVGRAWGGSVTGLPATGRLRDAGVGLRFGLTRSGLGNVIHVDVAFPFDGDPSIAHAQIHIVTKSSF